MCIIFREKMSGLPFGANKYLLHISESQESKVTMQQRWHCPVHSFYDQMELQSYVYGQCITTMVNRYHGTEQIAGLENLVQLLMFPGIETVCMWLSLPPLLT